MIQVTVGNIASNTKTIVEDTATPKEVFKKVGIDYSLATIHLDGAVLNSAQMNTSLHDLGCVDTAMLIAVVKQENA